MTILSIGQSVKNLRQKFACSTGLPIRDALSAETIESALLTDAVCLIRSSPCGRFSLRSSIAIVSAAKH